MNFFELSGFFLLLLLLAGLFFPFMGGCFIIFLSLIIFSSILVFFSLNLVWFVIAGVILYGIGYITKYFKWLKLPEFNQYILDHPQCKLPNTVACYNCGADKITHHGLLFKRSKLRYYICTICGTSLFRFKVL